MTVAVSRRDVEPVLEADRGRLVVRSQGKRREFELVSLFRRAGKRIERLSVRTGSPLDGTTLGAAGVREAFGVAVLAVRRSPEDAGERRWVFSPRGSDELAAGDDLFVVGGRDAIERFREAVAG